MLDFSKGDEVFLEAQVQNITSSPMVMESVRLEPSAVYTVTDLNSIMIDPKRGDGDGWVLSYIKHCSSLWRGTLSQFVWVC